MADFYANQQSILNAIPSGQPLVNRIPSDSRHGRLRFFESVFIGPSSGTAPAIGDKIRWGALPINARVIGHMSKLYFNAGTAACTINLGDNMLATRHLAATAINAAGSAVPEAAANVNTGTGTSTINTNTVTVTAGFGAYQVGALITGTGIATGTTITAYDPVGKIAYLSINATASGSNTHRITGRAYRTSDNSSSFANAFSSTTDDCNLVSVVAGAQIANLQVITLKVAYTMD